MAVSKKLMPRSRGLFEEGLAVGFVEGPGVAAGAQGPGRCDAVGHAAETDAGDFEAGLSEIYIFHALLLRPGVPPY